MEDAAVRGPRGYRLQVTLPLDTLRWAERRRPFDRLEARVVQLHLERPDDDAEPIVQALRYVISFARLTQVRNAEGVDVDLSGPLALHAAEVREALEKPLLSNKSLWAAIRALPEVIEKTRRARQSVLEHLPVDRDSLEAEVTTRLLAVASGGGGGAGYVYPGCYDILDRSGLIPDLMVGTSIGSLMSMFRCRRRPFDVAALVAAARRLSWSRIFRVLDTSSRYGVPATLRLYLRGALGSLFLTEDGEPMRLSDMAIPLYIVATGLTVDAFKHDLGYYEHFLDDAVGGRQGMSIRGTMKAMRMLLEFLGNREALVPCVIGRDPGTEAFDTLDAAGFSSAVPGVIHYDVLRDDPHMHRVLNALYAARGITRLGEGGLVHNVPARIAWESVVSGRWGRRNVFVLALDCFAPSARSLAWAPLQQAVRSGNVDSDRAFADLYLPMHRTLSPMNLVPDVKDAMEAIRWGRDELRPHMPFVRSMCAPLDVLPDQGPVVP